MYAIIGIFDIHVFSKHVNFVEYDHLRRHIQVTYNYIVSSVVKGLSRIMLLTVIHRDYMARPCPMNV